MNTSRREAISKIVATFSAGMAGVGAAHVIDARDQDSEVMVIFTLPDGISDGQSKQFADRWRAGLKGTAFEGKVIGMVVAGMSTTAIAMKNGRAVIVPSEI